MTLDTLNTFFQSYSNALYLLFGLACSVTLYFVFGRKKEFSPEAMQNTVVSISCFAVNMLAALIFLDEINDFLQAAYDVLNVPHINPEFWTDVPFPVMVLIGLLVGDFCAYWNHRLLHTAWLWPAHAAHHSDTHVNAFTTFRIHFFETIVGMVTKIVVLTWLQMPETIPLIVVGGTLFNMYQHIDLDIHHGPLRYIIASPRYHRWHHADVPEAHGKNLADIFPFYDVMFGTYYVPGPCNEQLGTLESGIEDKTIWSVVAHPFKEWHKMVLQLINKRSEKESYSKLKPAAQTDDHYL